MKGVQLAAGTVAGINNGIDRFSLWQMFDCLWGSNVTYGTGRMYNGKTEGSEYSGGVHLCGFCPSLVKANGEVCPLNGEDCECENYTPYSSYIPRKSYYAANLLCRFLNNDNAKVLKTSVEAGNDRYSIDSVTGEVSGLYTTAIKNDKGQTVILVVNANDQLKSVNINLSSGKNLTFDRYVYEADNIHPTEEAKGIESDKQFNIFGGEMRDYIPARSFAVYVESSVGGKDTEVELGE